MGMLARISRVFGRSSRTDIMTLEEYEGLVAKGVNVGPFPADTTFFETLRVRLADDPLISPFRQHAWVFAAVSAIARNISQVPFIIKKAGGGADAKPLEEGPLFDLFRHPNPSMSRYELWEATVIYLMIDGEVLWIMQGADLDGGLAEGEVPREIWPTSGKFFKPVIEQKVIVAWEFNGPRGKKEVIPASQTIHHKLFNPDSPLRGLSPLAAARKAVEQDWQASLYNEAFFRNGADPGGILISKSNKPLTEQQVRQIRREWEDRHMGSRKRSRMSILSNMDYKQISTNQKDMEFLKQRQWSRDEVLAVFKVPKSEVSLDEQINRATAQTQDRGFWMKTLIPLIRMFEDKVDADLFSRVEGDRLEGMFDTSVVEALQQNFKEAVDTAKVLFDIGWPPNAINERLQLGLPKVPWGDDVFLDLNKVPARELVGATPPEDDEDEGETDISLLSASNGNGRTLIPAEIKRPRDAVMIWNRHRRQILDKNERKFAGKMRRYFFEMGSDQLKIFDKVVGTEKSLLITRVFTAEDVERALFLKKEWDTKIRRRTRPLFADITEQAIAQVGEELGGLFSTDLISPEIVDALEQKEILITRINARMRERVRSQLLKGLEAAETVGELRDRIKREFKFAQSRSLTIARTETAQTVSTARQITMKNEGMEKKRWITAGDELVREGHVIAERAGPIGIDERFPGSGLLHPSEVGGPAGQVINCRCVHIAVVKEP